MALKSVAKGRIVINDLTDSRQLVAYLSSTNRRQVIYNPDTNEYLPDYATVNNVLSPELYLSGSTLNKIEDAVSVTWSVQTNSMGAFTPVVANQYYAFGAKHALVIKDNILKDNLSMLYKVDIVYHDIPLNKDILIQTDIEIVKLTNGSSKTASTTIMVLSNDSHTIPTNSLGAGANFTGAETEVQVYTGTQDVTADWVVTATPSTGVTGAIRNLGTVTLGSNLYNQATAKNIYMYYGAETPSNEEDWTSDYIEIALNTDYQYKQLYTNEMGYVATPYTCFTYFDKDKNYLYQEVKEEAGLPIGTSKEYTYTVKSSVAGVKYVKTNGNLMFDGAFFAKFFSAGTPDTRVIYDVTGMTVDVGYVDFKATKESNTLTKRFTLTKSKSGYTPVKGVDYFDGAQGKSSYLWIRYSQSSNGASMTTNPTGATYIGTTTTDTATPPTLPSAFQWVKFVGEQGIGVPGADGESSYLHQKYSNDGGTTFTANNGETFGDYLGTLIDNVLADSLVPSAYKWGKITGDDATAYKLLISPKVIKKDKLGVLDATSFTATGKSQTGTGAFTNYAGRFTIEEDKGSGLVLKYTSVGNEVSKAYAISADTKSIRVRLYLAGGTSTILDEETLTVVTDGATGVDAVLLTVSTPDGDVIKNSLGNLRATAELYEGIKTVTATAYQWYARNPAGTGDTDSGVGWDKLTTGTAGGTTGFTTKTLTITPSAIAGSATFMVIVTYAGVKLRREVTVQDITDTYTFATIGNGNFKNGQGSNIFTQKVYQNGVEVDVAGTKFQYQWNIYNNDGTMNTSFVKVGKTITLLATEYVGKGYLYCRVSG